MIAARPLRRCLLPVRRHVRLASHLPPSRALFHEMAQSQRLRSAPKSHLPCPDLWNSVRNAPSIPVTIQRLALRTAEPTPQRWNCALRLSARCSGKSVKSGRWSEGQTHSGGSGQYAVTASHRNYQAESRISMHGTSTIGLEQASRA